MTEQKENKWKQKNHNMVGKHETEKLQYKILKNRLKEKEKKTEETPRRAEESMAFPQRAGHKLKQRHHQYNMQVWTLGPRTGKLLNNLYP